VNHNSHVHSKTKVVPAILLILFVCAALDAQTPQQRHEQIIKAIIAGDRNSAISQLRAIRAADSQLFTANNYDYLLARFAEEAGDVADSQASYQAVVERKSLLSGYALWHLAQHARATGDLVLERERLRQFLSMQTNDALRIAAMLRLGESFMESEDYSSVVSSLQPVLASSSVPLARKAQLLTAQAFLNNKTPAEARDLFRTILMKMPDASRPDDFALEAVRALDSLDNEAKTNISEADHLLRGSVYQFNRHFDEARTHYAAVAENNPKNPTVANALYQIGRGLYLQQRYDDAINYFRRVVNEFPQTDSARDALSFTAASFNRLKRTDDAIASYKQFLTQYPNAPNPERTYLNTIDALHEAARYGEALDWVRQARARFANQLGESLALFAQLRIHLAQQEWSAVVADAEELKKTGDLGGNRVPSGTSTAEVLFLQGFAFEQLQNINQAVEVYLSIPAGRDEYFGQRATDRLRALAANSASRTLLQSRANALSAEAKQASQNGQHDAARAAAQNALRLLDGQPAEEMEQVLRTSYAALPAYKFQNFNLTSMGQRNATTQAIAKETTPTAIAAELMFLGVFDEAIPAYVAPQSPVASTTAKTSLPQTTPSDQDYTIAVLALRGGLGNIAVRFAEKLWRSIPADYVLSIAPKEYVELLYPAPYARSLLKHGPPRGLDPRFVLSIARQESRFQADAKSAAAARGMMQFIAETADQVGRELGKENFQQDELYNPDTAILFGAQYLSGLFHRFPGQPEAVAAAYNGGPDNIARWMARSRSQAPERYVAEIGFAQTKDYVFRIMTNYRAYQQLYDSNLKRNQ